MNRCRPSIAALMGLMVLAPETMASTDSDFSLLPAPTDGGACIVCTDSPGLRRHESYGDVVLRRMDELGLTDEQMGRIVKIRQATQARIQALDQQLRAATRSAHALFLNPATDAATIRHTASDHTTAFNELVETALAARDSINAVLTGEQRQKLAGMQGKP